MATKWSHAFVQEPSLKIFVDVYRMRDSVVTRNLIEGAVVRTGCDEVHWVRRCRRAKCFIVTQPIAAQEEELVLRVLCSKMAISIRLSHLPSTAHWVGLQGLDDTKAFCDMLHWHAPQHESISYTRIRVLRKKCHVAISLDSARSGASRRSYSEDSTARGGESNPDPIGFEIGGYSLIPTPR